jgi:hypothetical protein
MTTAQIAGQLNAEGSAPYCEPGGYVNFMAQHEQLRVLGGRRTTEQHEPAADPDEDQIEQTEGHG